LSGNQNRLFKEQTMSQWFESIITRMYELVHHHEQDNFDAERYPDISPTTFYIGHHVPYFLFLESHRRDFFKARSLLADEDSRDLFDLLVLYRLLGHAHVRLPFNTPVFRSYRSTVEQWRVEDTSDGGLYGRLSIFAVPIDDDVLVFKCWPGNVAAHFLFHQYYFDRNGIRIKPETGDHILDVGACFGDTALGFSQTVGDTGRIYTFDPMPKHCAIIREMLAMNPDMARRITLYDFGLSDRDHDVAAAHAGEINPGARVDEGLPTRKLDALALPRVDFVKMDVEGSELAALRGAEQTIRRDKPKLAISLYHRPEDFFAIPLWLDGLRVGYRFHLDHYSIHHEETVLYASVGA
jgi:FkbM family methyltransferase